MTTRRGLLLGLTGFVACAPAIVRVSSLMPVRSWAEGDLQIMVIFHDDCTKAFARIIAKAALPMLTTPQVKWSCLR